MFELLRAVRSALQFLVGRPGEFQISTSCLATMGINRCVGVLPNQNSVFIFGDGRIKMFSCMICDKKFSSVMERTQHVSDDMIVSLVEPEVPLLFPGEMVMPLTCEDAMGRLKGAMQNTASRLTLCEKCPGCEICANTWDAKAVYDNTGCFKVPMPVKRGAQDNNEAGPSKRAMTDKVLKSKKEMDDLWFCRDGVLSTQDDEWLCEGAKDFDSNDNEWLCAAASAVDRTGSQEELRRAVGEIAELDPTQTMHDFWAAMDEMASVNTPEEAAESGMMIEQIGGALGDRVSCPICALVFSNYRNMHRHKIFTHGNMFCPRRGQKFQNRTELMIYRRVCDVRGLPTNIPLSEFFNTEIFTALNKSVVTYCFKPKMTTDALVLCLSEFESFVTPILDNYIRLSITFKVEVSCQVTMHKLTDANTKIQPVFGHRQLRPLLLIQTQDEVREMLAGELEAIKIWIEEYNKSASNWILESVDHVCINCHETDNDAGGAGAVKLPDRIKNVQCIVNLEASPYNESFKYAFLAAAHYGEVVDYKHRERIHNYDGFAQRYDFSVVTYPVNPLQIQLFEKANKTVSVWAHYLVQGQARCLYRSTCPERPVTVHLFRFEEHWLPIINLSALYRSNRQGNYYKCVKCFKSFYHTENYAKHLETQCDGRLHVQHETVPNPPQLNFTDFEKTVDMPLVMYADIEAILKEQDVAETNTKKTHKHMPAAIGNIVISRMPGNELHEKYVEHVGAHCIVQFIEYLEEICRKVHEWEESFFTRTKAQRNFAEKAAFDAATECYLCKRIFAEARGAGEEKNFDHDHLTGFYRGGAR